MLVTRAYPIHQRCSKNKVANLTISGISRIQLIAIATPFQTINLLNQVQKRQIKVAYRPTLVFSSRDHMVKRTGQSLYSATS